MENIRKEISLGDEREQQQHEIAHARLRDILGPGGKVVIPTQDLLELKSLKKFRTQLEKTEEAQEVR